MLPFLFLAVSSPPMSSARFPDPGTPKDLADQRSFAVDCMNWISEFLRRCNAKLSAKMNDRCCESYSDKSDCEMVPKLSDFGLSKILDGDFGLSKTTVVGTRGYLSPDYMEPGFTTKSDVYSFGMVLLELLLSRKDRYYGRSRISVDDGRCHDWMANGMTPLNNFLDTREPALQPDCSSYMSWATRYKIIIRIYEGLRSLHMGKHSIIHLDLKPSQILLDRDMLPKLSDFGLSKPLDGNVSLSKTTVVGNFGISKTSVVDKHLGYMAPECTEEAVERMDIFSLGVKIIEIMCSHRKDRISLVDDYIQDSWANVRTYLDLHPRDPALQPDCIRFASYRSRATRHKKIIVFCGGHNNERMQIKPFIIHGDLKPSNILLNHLDNNFVPKVMGSQILKLLCSDVEIPVNAANTQNSLSDVDFTVAASAKGDTEIKIGYHVRHLLKYLGVHHPLFLTVLFAHKKYVDALKSVAPKGILDMAKRLSSSALLNLCKANWISAILELLKVETIDEYNTGKSVGSRKELTENETHHSVPDSCGAEHGIKEWKPNTSTAWSVSTAAPHHATGNRNILSGFVTEHDNQFVHALDGVPMKVLARGAVVTDAVVLPDVWFVPGLKANLVSVSQLAELGYSVRFDCGECYIRSAADGMIMGKAHLQEGGLYVLDFLKVSLAM